MIKWFLKVLIIYGIQQEILTHRLNVEKRVNAIRHKLKKQIKEIQLPPQVEQQQEFIDNYDLIVQESTTVQIKQPQLRSGHRHRHRVRKYRARANANIPSTTEDPQTKTYITKSHPISTTPNIINDSFEKNVKILEAKVEAAIQNLTNYLSRSGAENIAKSMLPPRRGNNLTDYQSGVLNMPTPSFSPRRGNNLTDYFSKSGAENTATSMHPPRRDNNLTEYFSKSGAENTATSMHPPRRGKNLTDYFSNSGAGNIATTTFSPRGVKQKVTPNIPFHRRFNYMHDSERNKPQKWVHCLDLITPKLQGMKEESRKKVVSSNDSDVRRLAQLIFTDVSKFNAEDMVSILSQISKIRIRMYQWDQNAITMIFNIIIKGSVHSFHTLKAGVKELIAKWHLDLSMMRVFLEQTRIFRPPCIDITGYQGFSKKPGGVIPYTKPDKPKKYRDPNVSCQSKEKHEPYDNENP